MTFRMPPNFLRVRKAIGTAGLFDESDQTYIDILDFEGGLYESNGIAVIGVLPGMVPPYEEHSARIKAGYTIPEWRTLDWIERAIEVAMYRIGNKVEAIMNEQMKEESSRKK